ncbi:MAG: hypothetical protein HQL54_09235 [Magnetococcales bacterium]|nr:hypothetical protein [Magnetococcales bacterium]
MHNTQIVSHYLTGSTRDMGWINRPVAVFENVFFGGAKPLIQFFFSSRILLVGLTFLCFFMLGINTVYSKNFEKSFSADVVRNHPHHPERNSSGRMFVSPSKVRTEGILDGHAVVILFHTDQNKAWMLFPKQKRFTPYPGKDFSRPPLPYEKESPCYTNPAYQCHKRGRIRIEGRLVEHWEVFVLHEGRRMPHMQLWVDPKLKIAIREHYADGMTVELKNLHEGAQPPNMFTIPVDYKELPSEKEAAKE